MSEQLPRAFLSHSSTDKEFVSSVANRLGRHRVAFDAMHFESGQTFVSQIESYINTSEIFVFFVSPRSLKSFWCTFEVDSAKLALIRGFLRRSLTYIISNTVELNEIPAWLRESKVIFQPCIGQVVRNIDHHLLSLLPAAKKPPFVGRNALKARFLEELVKPTKQQVFIMSGLEAVGRRSYANNVLEENLAIRPGPTLSFDPLVGLEDLYAQLLTDAEHHSADSLRLNLAAFAALNTERQVGEVLAKLEIATADSEYPVFVDQGGLTDRQGAYSEPFRSLIERYISTGQTTRYLTLIHRGKPYFPSLAISNSCLHQAVPALLKAESVGLLRRLLSASELVIDETELQQCAELSEGYPPAIAFVAGFIQKYGPKTLLHSPESVTALKRRVFVKFLKELELDVDGATVLRYLAREGPLQFGIIAAALEMSEHALASQLLALVDLSLITYETPHYAISWPIRDSVIRVWGELPDSRYLRIAANLAAITSQTQEIPDIDTIDAILTAQIRCGTGIDFSGTGLPVLPSSLVKLSERCYHQRDYEKAFDLSVRAVENAKTRPQRLTALSIQAKSLVNMQRWSEAEAVIDLLDKDVARERFYIRGFMLRKRRRFVEASAEYEKAIATGHNPNSVLRDSADCLFRLGKFDEAITRINVVRERDRDNPWVLDLLARCYTDAKNDVGFQDVLRDLKACDTEGRFWQHREAVYFSKHGDLANALALAERACSVSQPPFESFALRVDICIESGTYPKAHAYLNDMRAKFRNSYGDIQSSLWCKYNLSQGRWQEAESFWSNLTDKDLAIHRSLRYRILEAKAKDARLTLLVRQAADAEAKQILREGRIADASLADDVVPQDGE